MRDGKIITTQPTEKVTLNDLVKYMVGREMKERFPKGNRHPGEVVFEVEDLEAVDPNNPTRKVLDGVSFNVRKGEILGIAGLMGSGRTELVLTLFGEYGKITKGKIRMDGKEIEPKSARQAIDDGLSLVPEDRKKMGLVLIQSILRNISLPNLDQFSKFFRIDANEEMAGQPAAGQKPDDQGLQPVCGGLDPLRRQPAEGGHLKMAAFQAEGPDHG